MFYKFDIYDGVINDGSVTNGVIKDAYIANGNFNGSYVVNGTSGTVISGVYVGDAPIVNIGSMHQGYLIDNFTGYVYSCDAKLEFKNGFVVKKGKYYDFAIDSDGKLSLDLVVRNESLHIYNIFKDKYGNKYVQNDYLDAYDADNKTVYYTKTNYFLARDGTAIHIDYTGQFNYSEMPSSFTVLERMNADFTASAISDAESYEIDFSPCNGNSSHDESNVVISHIADGYLYMYSTQGGAYTYYLRVRTDDFKSESRSYGMYSYDGGNWTYNCLKSAPIDADTVLWWTDWSGTPTLYYGDVWGNNAMSYSREMDGTFTIKNENVLLQNCKCVPDWKFDFKSIKFAYTTVEKTVFYMIVIDENGTPCVVDSENYKDDAKNTTVFQTIER